MKRRRILIIISILVVLVIAPAFLLLRPVHYDPTRVHPALASVKPPISGVRISYYLDGGSFHFVFTNAVGRSSFVLPAPRGSNDNYDLLFVGQPSKDHPIAPPDQCVPIDHHSRAFLADLIEKHAAPSYNQKLALAELRGRPIDRLRLYFPE